MDPLLALEISKKYAAHAVAAALRFGLPLFVHPSPSETSPAEPQRLLGPPGTSSQRLRVGYVSSDFGNHPLSHLMGSVFGMHDRRRTEVFCYALSANDNSEWRTRIAAEAEHFVEVACWKSDAIARRVYEDGIQILVNLNGYTKGARNDVFALRPAPIQVSYMGFPGTTGADYIDYLVTDKVVSPRSLAHIYSEKLVHVPNCYFVNDYKQRDMDVLDKSSLPRRSTYGLPEDKFLFACFNQLYKMDPEIVTTWCSILKRVPNSALWLLLFPAAGEAGLRKFCATQGVHADQIIFTNVAGKKEHIKRSVLADLFLDTPLCNAHTTGTDVLWAGLPMVTRPLERMATRVAASLCYATGLGEHMVTNSPKEYEERAVALACNPPLLQRLRGELRARRLSCALFDTQRWVGHLDTALATMWLIHSKGRPPQHFEVVER
eukprot:TRINITY_DN555_c1_g1_i1.p1 TRINITY_DN555_c1_g1~~TRINITY_DN555_c1_g1_i1.p1  ORF type:complete len:434 (+),score=67.76 TRINITY_DN555_c1_g1_i1:232-1533(+)